MTIRPGILDGWETSARLNHMATPRPRCASSMVIRCPVAAELRRPERLIVVENAQFFLERWYEYFDGEN
jgi:hypothetical protein